MATITSSTHGPFDLGSTWVGGVAPVNGDAFIINSGHVVSVTGDQRKTNGFDDSFIRGKLHMFSGSLLRMSGILYVDNTANYGAYFASGNSATAGFFRMDHGSILELAGTNADQHRLEIRNQRFITCEIEGNNPNPQTVVSGNYDVNALKFSVSGLSGITRGDWISVYKSSRPSGANTGGIYLNNASDEGMWVHDVSGNDIYFRKFVSPTGTITSSTVSGVTVNDASVFRSGYAVVFGTGVNLNLQQISNINYGANTIDFNSSVTGSVVGEVIYRTSFDKAHRDGDTVQKIASSLIATSNIGANTITVNSVQGFSVNDLILIPANDPANTSAVDIVQDYRISGISGTTITLKAGFTNTGQNTLASPALIGGIVANMQRETQITAPSGTPYLINQAAGHGAFVYAPSYTTDFTRKLKITNTLFTVSSNTNSTTFGNFSILGYFAYDEQSSSATKGAYTSVIEGNVIYPTNRQANSNTALNQNLYSINIRNNISYNSLTYGFGVTTFNVGFLNNIICRNQNIGLIVNECAYSNTDISYNYLIRTLIGMSYRIVYEPNHRFAHNYILYSITRPYDFYYSHSGILFSDFYIDGFTTWPLITNRCGSPMIIKNSYMGNKWDITTPIGSGLLYNDGLRLATEFSNSRTVDGIGGLIQSVNHNFKFDQFRTWGQLAWRAYDPSELAWRVYPDLNSTTIGVYNTSQSVSAQVGFMNTIYVPAGARVFITGQVKTSSRFSANTNYPYLIARTSHDYFWGQYRTLAATEQSSSSSTTSEAAGFMTRQRFTAASATAYETITLTIPAQKFDYFLSYGVVCDSPNSSNGRNGWYEKNISASIDKPSQCADQLLLNHLTSQLPITIKQTPNQLKTILGG